MQQTTRRLRLATLAVLAAVPFTACNPSNPARPTMTFAAPLTAGPANGTTYNFTQQPITLTIANSVRTGPAAVTYAVEVSTSSTFGSTAFSRDGIAEGSSGVTTFQLPQLEGNTTYYWRWKATVDGITGEPSSSQSFFVRPNIVIQTATLLDPANNTQIFGARPTFRVQNAARTGPAGTIFYEFQVSTSQGFGSLVATATVQEQANSTSWTPSTDLPEAVLFWRVRASNPANGISGAFSNSVSFERKFGIDLATVTYVGSYPNISTWQETARITSASHGAGILCIEHTRLNVWPGLPFIFDPSTIVEGNQFMFANIGGKWFGGSGHWYRPGQACKGEVDEHFFIDAFRGAPPFDSLVLRPGDVFGVAVTTPSRVWPYAGGYNERSNVVLLVWN